jgi:hypothetical protein
MKRYWTPFVRRFAVLAFLAATVMSLAYTNQEMQLQRSSWNSKYPQIFYLPSSKILEVGSLGHKSFLADLIWIRSLLYVGTHLSSEGGDIIWLPKYLNAIIKLDPKFRRAYVWGAILMTYNRDKPTRKRALISMKILKKGYRQFPDDYYFPHAIGMAHLSEITLAKRTLKQLKQDYKTYCKKTAPALPWKKLALKIRSCLREIAGRYLIEAGNKENAPAHIAALGAGFMGRGMGKRGYVAICTNLIDVLWSSNNNKVREQVRKRMKRYCSPKVLKVIFCQERAYTTRWRKTMPYISRTLYGLMDLNPAVVSQKPLRYPLPLRPEVSCLQSK